MEESAVNIARALLSGKVCPSRPPSGKRERDKIISTYARQLSSTKGRSYRPSSASTKGANQGTSNPKLFVKVDRSKNTQSHQHGAVSSHDESSKRRVQSAKARLTNSDSCRNKPPPGLERRHSAKVRWDSTANNPTENGTARLQLPDKPEPDSLEPCVYGYKSRRRICRSEADISKLGKPLKSCLKASSQNLGSSQTTVASRGEEDLLTDEALGVFADDEDTEDEEGDDEEDDQEQAADIGLPLPKTLRPLAHWWTPDIPPEYLGVDHLRCWVFLPSMVKDYHDLPVVPTKVTDPTEELPYKEKITEPTPWAPKKYSHPWTRRPLSEHQCKHGHGSSTVPPLKIYGPEGRVVHETTRARRTVGVVRREIEELELLLQGIGSADSCSLVVQYQYEINQLQNMVDSTLGRVEEIEKREREKQAALERKITDYCGLRQFYKEHDEVIRQIHMQHDRCIRELAILERDLKLDSDRAHFRKKHKAALKSESTKFEIVSNRFLEEIFIQTY